MSPRAACRLETLGFADVYDYVPGKVDWLAHNLAVEGELANVATAGRLARTDAVTCRLDEVGSAVRERIDSSPYGFALPLRRTSRTRRVRRSSFSRRRRAAAAGHPLSSRTRLR